MNGIKKSELKGMNELNDLAQEANSKYTLNKYLIQKLENYRYYNKITKDTLTKCMTDKQTSPISLFAQYSNEIQKDCNDKKNDYNNYFSKYNLLLSECQSDLTMGKPLLSQKKNEQFTLDNAKIEKDNTINAIKDSINSSKKFHLFREPRRDNLIDAKKGNRYMERETAKLQKNILKGAKKCNKLSNKIDKYKSQIFRINKNNKLLENYIEKYKFKKNNSRNLEGEYENKSDDDKDDEKGIKKIKRDFMTVENLLDEILVAENEEGEKEEIIDNELHSDDETVFENKIKHKNQITTNHLDEIKKIVPGFNFKQIVFNRNKQIDIDLYTLQRRIFKKKTLNSQINETSKKIEKLTFKLTLLKQKEETIREFVQKLQDNYEYIKNMIYQKSVGNIVQTDYITGLLNNPPKDDKNMEKDKIIQFFEDIPETEEYAYKEDDDEKKETKDTIRKEYEEDKIEAKISEKKVINIKKVNRNFQRKKTENYKHRKNEILISMPKKAEKSFNRSGSK